MNRNDKTVLAGVGCLLSAIGLAYAAHAWKVSVLDYPVLILLLACAGLAIAALRNN